MYETTSNSLRNWQNKRIYHWKNFHDRLILWPCQSNVAIGTFHNQSSRFKHRSNQSPIRIATTSYLFVQQCMFARRDLQLQSKNFYQKMQTMHFYESALMFDDMFQSTHITRVRRIEFLTASFSAFLHLCIFEKPTSYFSSTYVTLSLNFVFVC